MVRGSVRDPRTAADTIRGEVGGEGEPGREDDLPLKPHKQPHAAILGLPVIINGLQGMQRSAASHTQRWRDVRQ